MPRAFHPIVLLGAFVLLAGGVAGCRATTPATFDPSARDVSSIEAPGLDPDSRPDWYRDYMVRGPEHAVLDRFVGRWTFEIRSWLAPGMPEIPPDSGTCEYEWIMDGRFLRGRYDMTLLGEPYEAEDTLAYDRYRGEYLATWIDTTRTSVRVARGTYDADRAELTMSGTDDDPIMDRRDQPFRSVARFVSDDEIVFELFSRAPDGELFVASVVTARRVR
ncbi:MAG: DUF1579 domain-containing protein [Phycisphaerales bacterium]|nr:DUF1579 domain-containing protein [Phycisphaerales bacterium]